jgi:malonyl-CoA O-methyltransferase
MGAGARLARWWTPSAQRVSLRDGYALWAPVYPPRPHNAVMEAESAIVVPLLAGAARCRALDVGTGTGRNAAQLRAAGARLVVAVDLSPDMLRRCGEPAGRVCADALALPFSSESFGMVSSSLMCGDVDNLAAWIREASRVLRPGGQLVYSDFHPSWSSAGWRRTFTAADGRTYELPFFPHTIEQHLDVLDEQGLEVRTVREPKIAGRSTPVVVVFHATKTRHRAG